LQSPGALLRPRWGARKCNALIAAVPVEARPRGLIPRGFVISGVSTPPYAPLHQNLLHGPWQTSRLTSIPFDPKRSETTSANKEIFEDVELFPSRSANRPGRDLKLFNSNELSIDTLQGNIIKISNRGTRN